MHAILARQLKRAGLCENEPPADSQGWKTLLSGVSGAYELADQDRYLLERSLSLSSEEMGELHKELAAERDTISAVICALTEGVCAVNSAGVVLFMNPEARRLLSIPEHADIRERVLFDLVGAVTHEGVSLQQLLASSDRAAPAGGDEPRLIVDGDESRFITYSVSPLGEQRDGLVLMLRDVTVRRSMEEEKRDLNRRLLEASRQAGMAEVASGVLHNVGNVLNSVNVSLSVATKAVKTSKMTGVAKVSDLLAQNRSRLPAYLTEDPVGSRLCDYISELGQQLCRERDQVLKELDNLRLSTDHIREIVSTQQSLATAVGMRELSDIIALADEAVRVAEPSLVRHRVRIVHESCPVPAVLVERHQVLQILINLINNAKQAVAGLPQDLRVITMRTSSREDRVVVEVIDGGRGIAPENMTRIFSHGFTTRKDGHGFGLHSAALSAKAMGGTIHAHSDGLGRGARFTLELPTMRTSTEAA